jgi:phosphate transport system substrate-binding protein
MSSTFLYFLLLFYNRIQSREEIMKTSKALLFAAVAASSFVASTAFAQSIVDPVMAGAELKGAGASSVETVVVQAFNCISGPTNAQQLGKGAPVPTGTLTTVAAGSFNPTVPNTANPVFNCATDSVQPNFKAFYNSTGSGFGREIWRNFSNRFVSGIPAATNANPFEGTTGVWNNVQFAFSDGPISASDVTAYNTNANSATNKAGAAIQIPLYVLPVALAYNPQYGTTSLGTPLNFVVPVGGIKLTTSEYCGIFNGTVTNFKQVVKTGQTLKATGLGAEQTAEDARWTADGVPIRLIGRLDNSGTTDIFTRHLSQANVCGTVGNKFSAGANQQLPAAAVGTGVFTSGALTAGAETPGLFARATGSSGVRDAINAAPNVPTASANGTLLNGKLGYVSADFVAPADTGGAVAAQLTQVGSTTVYKKPNATDAAAAFATIVPPQSIASGAYAAADLRKNSVTGLPVNRANPLDWADVLYSRADLNGGFTAKTLAAPSVGYPITGTTFMLTSTCFKSDANRYAVTEFLYANLKKITKNSTNGNVSTSLLSGPGATLLGLTAKNGLSPLSAAWQKAIFDTFLVQTGTAANTLGSRGLWIQSKQPTTTLTGVTSNTGGTDSNVGGVAAAACTAGAGA